MAAGGRIGAIVTRPRGPRLPSDLPPPRHISTLLEEAEFDLMRKDVKKRFTETQIIRLFGRRRPVCR